MKKIFLNFIFLSTLFTSVQAKYLNGLAAVVNNEPITDYDVELIMKKLQISPNDALNILIREKLEDSQIKELGILVSQDEVLRNLTALAKENGFSDFASFAKVISDRGVDINELQNDERKNLAKAKLYEYIMSQPNENITRENALRFYEKNQGIFTRFSSAKVTKYTATSGTILENFRLGKVMSGVTSTDLTIYPQTSDTRILNLVASTNEGSFTPIITEGSLYVTYKVNKKEDAKLASFEEVESSVATMMIEQERETLLADYFNKLRSKASIQIIKR